VVHQSLANQWIVGDLEEYREWRLPPGEKEYVEKYRDKGSEGYRLEVIIEEEEEFCTVPVAYVCIYA